MTELDSVGCLSGEKMYRLYGKIATHWPIGSTEGEEGIGLIPSHWELMELAGRLPFEQQLP